MSWGGGWAFPPRFLTLASMGSDRERGRVADRIADVMFALSTPSRVHLLLCLLDGPRSVSELVDRVGGEQSAVSHQLRVLREHSLVRVDRDGRRRVYALADEEVAGLLDHAVRHVQDQTTGGSRRRLRAQGG